MKKIPRISQSKSTDEEIVYKSHVLTKKTKLKTNSIMYSSFRI